jgi:hypothetical protein
MEINDVSSTIAFCMKRIISLSGVYLLAILLTCSQVFAQATGISQAQANPAAQPPVGAPFQPTSLQSFQQNLRLNLIHQERGNRSWSLKQGQ